ncbi:ABC transporter substrate-binding protein [Streptomyces sp. NPDC087440]|uniref:ABC transporter substrate-binding protein n=1 Tax=Streptomyces sp. NPDC087440 TaxID=3365790 RepID=UPI003816E6F8
MRLRTTTKSTALVAVAALALTLSACGGASSAGGGEDSKEFTYWSMYKEDEPRAKVIKDAVAAFTQETGIKVELVFQGREVLNKLQPTLVGGNVAADLVDQSQFKIRDTLAATGNARDLSGVLDAKVTGESKTVGETVPKAYQDLVKDKEGQTYLIPTNVQTWQVFYNKKQLPDVAANPPKTFDEFIALLDKRKAAGKAPLALDGDILAYVDQWVSTLMIRELGAGNWKKVLEDKSGAGFDKPEVLKAAQNAEKIGKGTYFVDGWDASKFPAIQQKWAQNKADFLYMGTWGPSETGEIAGKDFEYGSFPFPKTAAGHDSEQASLYGYGIPKKAKNGVAAEKFIQFFLGKKWMDRLATEEKSITVRADVPAVKDLQGPQKALQGAGSIHVSQDGVEGMSDWETKITQPLSKKLISGQISAADYVAELKKSTVNWWKANG